jgi:hypothetical protein
MQRKAANGFLEAVGSFFVGAGLKTFPSKITPLNSNHAQLS